MRVFGAVGSVGVLGAALLLVACGGDDSPPPGGTGGSVATGGAGGTGGEDPGTGGGDPGTGGTAGTGGEDGPGFACTHDAVPPNGNITDFSPDTYQSNGEWGDSESLTGGTFDYQDGDNPGLDRAVVEEAWNITGTLTAGTYAGAGFWFGPCSDASAFTGVAFTIHGTVPEEFELEVQIQTSRNYPISETDMKGECEGDWGSPCNSNTVNNIPVTDTATTITIAWDEATDGAPIDGLDPTELLGIQWHFNCGDAGDCPIDVTIDDVHFVSE